MEFSVNATESVIASIRKNGSDEDKAKLDYYISVAEKQGVTAPYMLIQRINFPWFREHSKAYKTPTILKKWKDAMPADVAVWFFDECDIIAIENAFEFDFSTKAGKDIDSKILVTCYAYLGLTGERNLHGTWHQGKKAFEEATLFYRSRMTRAAKVLHSLCTSNAPVNIKNDPFLAKYLKEIREDGKVTCDIVPMSFSGEGRRELLE